MSNYRVMSGNMGKCTPSVWFLVFSLVRPFNALQNHNEYGALIHFKSQTCTCYVFNFHWPNCTLSIPPKRNQIVKFVPRLSNFQKFDAERLRKYKLASGHIQILNSKILCSMNPSTSLWGRHQPAVQRWKQCHLVVSVQQAVLTFGDFDSEIWSFSRR